MQEITEKYYVANDGKRFEDENKCKEYEEILPRIAELKDQIHALNKELAFAEYTAYHKGEYIKWTGRAGGNGHDGYYDKCPHCEELVGGYERRNTGLKVDEYTYKCEKCGGFFRYK